MSKKEITVNKNVVPNYTLEKQTLESKLKLMLFMLEFPELNLYLLLKTLFQEMMLLEKKKLLHLLN
jgi:hypothetical protein